MQFIAKNMQPKPSCMIFRNALNKTLRLFLLIILLFISPALYAQQASFSVIPEPVYIKKGNGGVNISPATTITYSDELKASGELLNEAIRSYTGVLLAVGTKSQANQLLLKLDSVAVKEKEGYHLLIEDDQILIRGHDQAGIFYGIQSLMQLWSLHTENSLRVEKGEIRDYPRFNYRGMHLDVGRHMYSVAFLKKFIDLLAVYKFNVFHWHLTEDQGWRIEIKKYPKLQSVSAWRAGTIIGHKKEAPHTFDSVKYGGYYTQDQIRDVVRYAASKYVNILPEIEMPGHALAALAAYPQLGCTGGPYKTAQFWGVFDDVFCAGNEEVYQFMEDVLDEVVGLFPYAYVHIGGDECPKLKWKHCVKCQQKIKENGLKDEHELQGYFMKRIEKYLNSKNRKAVGWDEVLEGGVSKNTTIMIWR
jgi:hexosaminidase